MWGRNKLLTVGQLQIHVNLITFFYLSNVEELPKIYLKIQKLLYLNVKGDYSKIKKETVLALLQDPLNHIRQDKTSSFSSHAISEEEVSMRLLFSQISLFYA